MFECGAGITLRFGEAELQPGEVLRRAGAHEKRFQARRRDRRIERGVNGNAQDLDERVLKLRRPDKKIRFVLSRTPARRRFPNAAIVLVSRTSGRPCAVHNCSVWARNSISTSPPGVNFRSHWLFPGNCAANFRAYRARRRSLWRCRLAR